MASVTLINNILTAMNNKLKVWGIFSDLQKAFNCVNHEILLKKFEFYGIEGKFKLLIRSYLTGRCQRVISGNGIDSNVVSHRARYWVLCFILYINDLPKIINKNNMVLFADDTSIIVWVW
jgi:hypothetical protein